LRRGAAKQQEPREIRASVDERPERLEQMRQALHFINHDQAFQLTERSFWMFELSSVNRRFQIKVRGRGIFARERLCECRFTTLSRPC